MNNSPCKVNGVDCPKRVLGCHDECKEYQEYAAEREQIRNQRIENLKINDFYHDQWNKKNKRH